MNRQRVSVPVHVFVDVSASMSFGSRVRKLQVAADFVAALGQSAFRVGDAVGMFAFDSHARMDLFMPALFSRGTGSLMASMLRNCQASTAGSEGLEEVALHVAGRHSLVFLISDFHWPLDRLAGVLEMLAAAHVVPVVIWDPAELQPPAQGRADALARHGVRRSPHVVDATANARPVGRGRRRPSSAIDEDLRPVWNAPVLR